MMADLPEEEEYREAMAAGGMDVTKTFEEEVKELVALAFGVMMIMAVIIVALVLAYVVTGWTIFLLLNLLFCGLAIVAFFYLMYRRSRLTMRI
jgi:uncharacterized membrane protein